MKLLESIQCGPRWAGHVRDIYAGAGVELWHETRNPPTIFGKWHETAQITLAALPATPPPGAIFCGMESSLYGDSEFPVIRWEGRECLDSALAFIEQMNTAAQ